MTDWYLAPSLDVLRAEINARWPGRDRASDGTIGDAAHQASTSDHNPNARGSVDAMDVDKDGVDVAAIIAAFERHPSAHYWIFNREIADVDDGWRRRPYSGPNSHEKHLHGSIRQTRTAEQDRRPWGLVEDEMTPEELMKADVLPWVDGPQYSVGGALYDTATRVIAVRDQVDKLVPVVEQLRQAVADLAARPAPAAVIDYAQLAAALPPGLARQVADELAARLAS